MGVLQALISFVSASKDSIRSIVAGDFRFVFFVREHIYLVGVSKGSESMQQLLLQLSYIYNQILSVLTITSLQKIFKQRRNYDLRRMLSGSEKFIDNLLNLMDHDPSFVLQAVRCLPLDGHVRDGIAQIIIQHARVKVRENCDFNPRKLYYSQTCIKRSPLEQRKSGLLRQVTS